MSDVCVVVPTIREASILEFLRAWAGPLAGARVIVVEDNPAKSFPLAGVEHYAWDDVERDLGERAWIIPRRSDCVRSYGFWKAWQGGAQVVVTLDDDCLPDTPDPLGEHRARLDGAERRRWVSTVRELMPRGMPFRRDSDRVRCVLNHGLWQGVPDLDAMTQLVRRGRGDAHEPFDQVIPAGLYFPMCGMNLAFRRELAPAMYFLLMGPDHAFDRFGDIWCGVLVKKICDHLGLSVASGEPRVHHARASDVWANLRKELPAYEVNETFWTAVDSVALTARTVGGAYVELAGKLPLTGAYWDRLRTAMRTWAELFEP